MNRLRFNATITCLSSRSTPLNTDESGFAPPDAFGPFRVRHAIGAGTLGPVYRAHEEDADRDVAVKLFRLDLPPERVHELVAELERLIAAGLSHPSLVIPVASGIAGTLAYLVEELVEGESLDVVLRDRGTAAPAQTLRIVGQLAAALDAAAGRGVFQGALHPRDVLGADADVARVTGIGVAQALEGVAAGVPVRRPYAAPERVAGGRWDRRADVFSLAALAFELLWGRRVVGVGEHAAGTLGAIEGGDGAALRSVFAQALAPSPGDRFETAGAFAAALSECVDAGRAVVRAAPPRRAARREPTPAAARTPVSASAEARLPLEPVEPAAPAEMLRTPEISEAVDLPLAPPGPVVRRIAREPGFDPPLAPVRVELGERPGDEWPVVGRRHRGAERTAAVLAPPERPLPLPMDTPGDDPHRSAIWSLALTAIVFLALGFAGGYWVASQAQPPQTSIAVEPQRSEVPPSSTTPTTIVDPDALMAPVSDQPTLADSTVAPPAPVLEPDPSASGANIAEAPVTPPAVPALPVERPAVSAAERAAVAPGPPAKVSQPASSRPAPRTSGRQPPVQTAGSARQSPGATVRAPARPGALQVDSRPPGANVYVDGRLRGRTPLLVEGVAAGEHGVRLQLDGYSEWLAAVQVEPGNKQRVAASLEPRN